MSSPAPTPFVPTEPFRPAPGLANPHAQTLLGVALRPGRTPQLQRERWDTPDGDFIDVDLLQAPASAPWVLALHGLEGSSKSGYITAILRGARERGWGALALNFRSCSGEPNRLLHSYSSGDTADVLFVLHRLRALTSGPLFGVGFSLGGNVLVKLLAEAGEVSLLRAAAAVSVPFDLTACSRALDTTRGWTRLYREVFLRSLRRKALLKAKAHPGRLDPRLIRDARGIEAFDDAVTARIYGFQSAADYYARCSSGPLLDSVRRPTLLVTSTDDPLVPGGAVPGSASRNPALFLAVTERGGHVGFVAGSLARPRFWAEEQVLAFFSAQLASSSA